MSVSLSAEKKSAANTWSNGLTSECSYDIVGKNVFHDDKLQLLELDDFEEVEQSLGLIFQVKDSTCRTRTAIQAITNNHSSTSRTDPIFWSSTDVLSLLLR